MKRIPLLILLFISIVSSNADAQVIKGAVIGGFNLSQVDGDEVFGYKRMGMNVGASAIIPFRERWAVCLETVFSQKGAFQKEQYYDSSRAFTGEYDLRLNYAEVPVLLQYNDKGGLTFGAGLSWGRLVGSKEIEHGGLHKPYSDTVPFNNNDFNVLADFRFRVWKRLKFNLRYSYSFTNIRKREYTNLAGQSWIRKQFNNTLSFRLVYVFNERDNYIRNE